MSKRRVVVTGLGAVNPIGNNVDDFWAGIREGKVGIGPITKFDTTDYKVKIAAELRILMQKIIWIREPQDVWIHSASMQ